MPIFFKIDFEIFRIFQKNHSFQTGYPISINIFVLIVFRYTYILGISMYQTIFFNLQNKFSSEKF